MVHIIDLPTLAYLFFSLRPGARRPMAPPSKTAWPAVLEGEIDLDTLAACRDDAFFGRAAVARVFYRSCWRGPRGRRTTSQASSMAPGPKTRALPSGTKSRANAAVELVGCTKTL